ncbi:sacsin-like isoform X2 [Dreissena polymorpha]|uniref:sacsin-like isoform X2 n=1 Tax=Dreissena polymorpha TaxID=45954 RepID=UPI002264CCFB|nr:sacsin-like isoform X2 [Dreissena polymorpha]
MEPRTVRLLWAFILDETKRPTAEEQTQNVKVFERNLAAISGWAFLPSKVTIQDHCIYELIPIERAYTLLSGYYNADIRTIAEKANIGTLDSSVFKDKTSIDNEVIDKLKGLISSQYKPDQLLLCVHYHKSKLLSCNITSDEAFKLLRVFDQSTNILTKKLKGQAKILLRELPLYETMQQGSFVSLDEVEDVVVSSSKMPPEGLNEWAHSQGKVVVKENILLKDLYTFLELPHNNDLDLYVRNIFPNMTHMPRQFWLAHVVYVKDHMLLTQLGRHFSKMQKRLIELVNNLPFIDIEGHFYCAHELYDRSHPVFATMLSEEQFLPAHFMDDNWKDFMEIIGLNIRPTGAMMLDYARQIARNGAMGVNEDLIAASNVIVSCLFGDFDDKLENDVFISIKGIKFVVPYTISSEMENIFRAYCSEKIFICFEGSCSGKSADICWTSASLTKRDPDEKQMNLLEITQEPQVDSVIKHCQNICSVFDDDFKREQTQHQNKVFYMERIYRFLERNTHQINARLLESIPVILIPEEAMVKASNVFVSAPERVELRPYLYKVPHKFERYIEFFKKLGASPEPTCLQYANVLRMIKDQFVNEEPPANILDVVSKAIQYFFESISTKTGEVRKHFESITHLYLPNQKRILMNSSELTVSDNDTFREELEERCNLSTFLGFTELNIQFNHLKDPFELLPKALQPRLLTDDVEEVISTENIIEVNSAEAEHVQRFVCSDQFFEGLCRLIQHDEVQNVDDELQDMLLHIGIKEVSGLKILLRYKGHMVEGVEIESDSNLQQTTLVDSESGKEIVCYSLFYQTDISENFGNMNSALRAGLMSLIEKCTHKQLSRESLLLLPQILDLYREPDIIGRFLDRNRIQKLDNISKRNLVVFPSPGTYVEERFYRFMVQKITPFRIHEFNYVALEIENDENNDSANSARFIYAHIEEEFRSDNTSTLHLRYSVHIGYNRGGTIVVPIFRLFKFIPLTTVTSQEVVEYDSEPISSIPFDTNCQRIMDELQEAFENFNIQDRRRIIRRMLLRWHPDRNPDHEEYSKRVFFFIQNCILRLERGEQLNLQPEPQMPDMRGSRYWNVCVDATNTGHVHTRGYQENLEEFNMFNRRGPHMYSPVSSPGEYRRWIRQAKRDFQTGQSHLNCAENHPDTYNWICYNCHQACEKALKAAWFLNDANKCRMREHSLVRIAEGLDDKIVQKAIEFEDRLCIQGPANFRLRYPDSVNSCQIPSEVFSKEDAEYAVTTTKTIIGLVEK